MPSTSYMQYNQNSYGLDFGRRYFVGTSSQAGGIVASDEGNGIPGDDTYGVEKDKPFATLAFALTKVFAGRGDRIEMLPGHTEAITGAAGVALGTGQNGVRIVGLGQVGVRPEISFTTSTAATMTVAGAGVVLENLDILCAIDEQATMITVTGASFGMKNCFVRISNATYQCAGTAITLGASSDRSWMEDVQFIGATANADGDLEALSIDTADDCYFKSCLFDIVGATGVGPVHYVGAALRQRWTDCILANRIGSATVVMDCDSLAVTGHMENCKFDIGTIAAAGVGLTTAVTCASGWMTFRNCGTINTLAESGGLPGAAST